MIEFCKSLGSAGIAELDPSTIARALQAEGAVIWLALQDPTDQDFDLLRAQFAFHPLAIEDCRNAHQRPKLDAYDDYSFLVLYEVGVDPLTRRLKTQELNLFLGPNYVVTIHSGPSSAIADVAARWQTGDGLQGEAASYLAYLLVDSAVDGYFPAVDVFSDHLEAVESRIFDRFDERIVSAIFDLKKETLALRRLITPLRDVFLVLLRGPGSGFGERTYVYFQDVLDHLLRVSDAIDIQRDLVSAALDAYQTAVSNRTNDTMKKLTVLSTVLMTSALIAGIYGMNFALMPELAWPYGYYGALYMMGSSSTLLVAIFYWKQYIGYDPTRPVDPHDLSQLFTKLKPPGRLSNLGTLLVLGLVGVPTVFAPFILIREAPAIVDKAKFQRLKAGMSYDQVATAIGVPGHESSAEDDGKAYHQVYTWTNPDGSLVTAIFDDGKLASRRYERLK
ncbi:MAG: magnesium and cobalt transport protein CorA [Cyanobacteria bacterium RYN_339]|nr:magnesium and cobalt transport protein CorA [Cyanobacteria bacterium RYN_339]